MILMARGPTRDGALLLVAMVIVGNIPTTLQAIPNPVIRVAAQLVAGLVILWAAVHIDPRARLTERPGAPTPLPLHPAGANGKDQEPDTVPDFERKN